MKQKIITIAIYSITTLLTTLFFILVGTELLTQYEMYSTGFTGIERHHIADDLGFGLILMFGLIPETILGVVCGVFLSKKINMKITNT